MVATRKISRSPWRRIALTAAATAAGLFCTGAIAQAQTGTHSYSSSSDYASSMNEELAGLSPAPAASASASAQYGKSSTPSYPEYQSRWSHFAFEAGGGATAPIGNDVRDHYDTWGYNLTFGGGWMFSKKLGALLEYQFNRNKIPGVTLSQLGIPYGNINTWSLTVDPIYYYAKFGNYGGYITGGGGFYRKVTNFSAPALTQQCFYFCYYGYTNQTVAHFSSNQGGLNIGTGLYWRAFGQDSRAKLYAEARYVWVDSPRPTKTQQGEGTEGLIPITIGLRF